MASSEVWRREAGVGRLRSVLPISNAAADLKALFHRSRPLRSRIRRVEDDVSDAVSPSLPLALGHEHQPSEAGPSLSRPSSPQFRNADLIIYVSQLFWSVSPSPSPLSSRLYPPDHSRFRCTGTPSAPSTSSSPFSSFSSASSSPPKAWPGDPFDYSASSSPRSESCLSLGLLSLSLSLHLN